MEGNSIPVNEGTVIVIRTSADLFLSGGDQPEVRFFGSEDRMQIRQEDGVLRVENHSGMDLIVPRFATVKVEKVGGSAFIQDLGRLDIQKIGGDLSLQRTEQVEIGKVGGSLTVRSITSLFRVQKVGGDLVARELGGPVLVDMVGGEADVQAADGDEFSLRAGGDLVAYLTRSVPGSTQMRAGGSASMYISGEANARFQVNSEGELIDIRITDQENPIEESVNRKHYEFTLGSGDGRVEIRAGGDVLVSNESLEPSSLAAEFDRLETSWNNARENRARYGWPGHFDPERSAAWADMIGRRAQEAARRAEQRAQSVARRIEEQTRRAVEREFRHGNFNPFDFTAAPTPPKPQSNPVTEQERLMVLQMLQEGKVTVEQAEALLRALEGRFKEE